MEDRLDDLITKISEITGNAQDRATGAAALCRALCKEIPSLADPICSILCNYVMSEFDAVDPPLDYLSSYDDAKDIIGRWNTCARLLRCAPDEVVYKLIDLVNDLTEAKDELRGLHEQEAGASI